MTNLEHAAMRLLDDWKHDRNLSEAANMLREALPDHLSGEPRTLVVVEIMGDVLSSAVDAALKRAGMTILGDTTAYALDPLRLDSTGENSIHQHDRPDQVCSCCGNITSYGYNDAGHCEACAEDIDEAEDDHATEADEEQDEVEPVRTMRDVQ